MLHELFLRDEDGSSGSDESKEKSEKELESEKPSTEPQDGGKADPKKPEGDKGLSAEEKTELEALRKEKETLTKRVSDTQREFHEKSGELKGLKAKVDELTHPVVKPENEFADDTQMQEIGRKIKAYQDNDYDTAPLDQLKAARIREIKLEGRLANLENRGKESDAIGNFLVDNPDAKDLTAAGKAKDELTKRGEKVSVDTAYHYDLGKKRKEDFDSAVKAEVERIRKLEADKKGEGARGQDGEFQEPTPPEKESEEYAEFLHNPGGFNLD